MLQVISFPLQRNGNPPTDCNRSWARPWMSSHKTSIKKKLHIGIRHFYFIPWFFSSWQTSQLQHIISEKKIKLLIQGQLCEAWNCIEHNQNWTLREWTCGRKHHILVYYAMHSFKRFMITKILSQPWQAMAKHHWFNGLSLYLVAVLLVSVLLLWLTQQKKASAHRQVTMKTRNRQTEAAIKIAQLPFCTIIFT